MSAAMSSKMSRSAVNGVRAAPKAMRPAVSRTVVVRAEETKVAKSERAAPLGNIGTIGASTSSLAYLDGTLPGDYGFDPLGLLDPSASGGFVNPEWLKYSEIIHCRFAMLGAAGCIAPEILGSMGVIPQESAITWYSSGVIPPAGSPDLYWTDSMSLFYVEVIAMQFAELRRLQDFRYPGSMGKQYFIGLEAIFKGSGNPSYPGGQFFNMANLGANDKEMMSLKKKEIENGRVAMLAMFGYGAQAVITREGPWANLTHHLADPVNNNILTNFGKVFGSAYCRGRARAG
ncbi:hypothetical protein FOA52_003096 [Chlamydomonas sp. UWO 241]|nr:hypothetical protein FOA52_003096 [Chlamydomonas sp. UWO 241]